MEDVRPEQFVPGRVLAPCEPGTWGEGVFLMDVDAPGMWLKVDEAKALRDALCRAYPLYARRVP